MSLDGKMADPESLDREMEQWFTSENAGFTGWASMVFIDNPADKLRGCKKNVKGGMQFLFNHVQVG